MVPSSRVAMSEKSWRSSPTMGGDYIFPVKDNQKTLRQDIETAFNEPVFPPVHMG